MTKEKPVRPIQLHAAHHSAYGVRLRPQGMTAVRGLTAEQVECMQRIALGIFADMSNAGYSLRESLAAIYLSGLMHAIDISRDQQS
jgi:hypothetical protein